MVGGFKVSASKPVPFFAGAAAAGASRAKKASSVPTKRPAITLPELGAVELPEVESPEAGEVVLGKMIGGKASKGKKAAELKPKEGGGHKATSQWCKGFNDSGEAPAGERLRRQTKADVEVQRTAGALGFRQEHADPYRGVLLLQPATSLAVGDHRARCLFFFGDLAGREA